MRDFNKLRDDSFFEKYFRKNSEIKVRPFLHSSDNLYFEKAYLEFLKSNPTIQDIAAIYSEMVIDAAAVIDAAVVTDVAAATLAESVMNWFYTLFNAAIAVLSLLKNMSLPTLILGVAWNLIDTLGAFIIAAKEGKNHDTWAQGINILSGIQMLAGTIASLLLNPDIVYIGIHASLGLSAIAAGASSFAFAAAMFFSWALEHREVKLHAGRINYLNKIIENVESIAIQTMVGKVANDYQEAKNQGKEIAFLNGLTPQSQECKELLKLLNFRQHQQQQLEIHERARWSWGLCAVFMTAVAIVSVTVIALGLSAATCGIAVAAVSFAAFLCSALYRNKPEVVEAAKTIENNSHSFFKPQPISCRSNDILLYPRLSI